MGISKKSLKNIAKSKKRMKPKTKAKAKKIKEVQERENLKASKRKAKAFEAATKDDGDEEAPDEEMSAVDDLLRSEIFGGDDAGSDGDDSSEGAFVGVDDIDNDEDDEGVPPEQEESDPAALERHKQELAALKESDPSFYKFLVENDKRLLDFGTDEPEEKDNEETAADEEASSALAGVLTIERLQRLRESAKNSFTGFKAILAAYRLAVRSIEAKQESADITEELQVKDSGRGKKRKKGGDPKKKKTKLTSILDEATFTESLEWTLSNAPELLAHHAGERMKKGASRAASAERRKDRRKEKIAEKQADGMDVRHYSRWLRVKVCSRLFWGETLFLLNQVSAPTMYGFILKAISTPQAIMWLWPFPKLLQSILRICCGLWSSSSSHQVRLYAFLFIRNCAAMAMRINIQGKGGGVDQLDRIIRQALTCFADVAGRGYSWRSLSTFRFMENCMLELLRLDDAMAYRVGYVHIRQLALVLRNTCVAISHGAGKQTGQESDKQKKKKGKQELALSNLYGWPFIRSLYLWSKAIGTVPSLKPLAYPLTMIITGSLKTKLTSLAYFPFVYHCIRCLNNLGAALELFVPVSSFILKSLCMSVPAIEKAHRNKAGSVAQAKAPEVDILLRVSDPQVGEVMTLEAFASSSIFLLSDHLGLLGRSPAFPEVSAPVLLHLKRLQKHCRSEALRRRMKTIVEVAETTASDITSRREAFAEVPSWTKFLLFEPDTAIAKDRAVALKKKESQEKLCVEAEMQERAGAGEAGEKNKKQKTVHKENEAKTKEVTEEKMTKKKKMKKEKKEQKSSGNLAELAPTAEDIVEEHEGFSSDSEE